MPATLPIEVYEVFEKNFGKDDAKKIIKSLELLIEDETINKWYETKTELKEELLKEVATKKDLEMVRQEMENNFKLVKQEMENAMVATKKDIEMVRMDFEHFRQEMKKDLELVRQEVKNETLKLDRKFTIMLVILFFTIIFLNQNALEFMARVLGLIK